MTIFCPESGTTYPDFPSFESGEQGADDKTAQITGKVAGGTIQGWTGHLTIEATTTPYGGANSATCDGLTSQLVVRNDNVTLSETKKIFVDHAGNLGAIRLGAFESVSNVSLSGGCSNTGTSSSAYGIETNNNAGGQFDIDEFIVERSGAGVWLRGNAPTSTVNHLLVVDSSAGQGFRGGIDNDAGAEIKNSLAIADPTAGQNDYAGSNYNASSDFLASGDSSASTFSATTSFINQTTAELVDFANGDFRTKSSSTLATGGESGTWIGGILESGGGGSISVDGQKSSFDFFALNSSIDLTGEINVSGVSASFDFISSPSIVDLTGDIQVEGQLASFNFFALDSNVDLTGEILITGSDADFDFIANDGLVTLTTDIQITGQSANFNFNGSNADIVLAGEISIEGNKATFNYGACSGIVKIGGGKKIGTVTAGFADNEISVKYKQRSITVRFGE